MHGLLAEHKNAVAPKASDPMSSVLDALGECPEAVPRSENAETSINLLDPARDIRSRSKKSSPRESVRRMSVMQSRRFSMDEGAAFADVDRDVLTLGEFIDKVLVVMATMPTKCYNFAKCAYGIGHVPLDKGGLADFLRDAIMEAESKAEEEKERAERGTAGAQEDNDAALKAWTCSMCSYRHASAYSVDYTNCRVCNTAKSVQGGEGAAPRAPSGAPPPPPPPPSQGHCEHASLPADADSNSSAASQVASRAHALLQTPPSGMTRLRRKITASGQRELHRSSSRL